MIDSKPSQKVFISGCMKSRSGTPSPAREGLTSAGATLHAQCPLDPIVLRVKIHYSGDDLGRSGGSILHEFEYIAFLIRVTRGSSTNSATLHARCPLDPEDRGPGSSTYPTTIFTIRPGTTITLRIVLPSTHFRMLSSSTAAFSISSLFASAGNSALARFFPLMLMG